MAEKKKTEKTKVLERKYVIPLRKEFEKVPYYKRAGKSMKAIRNFLKKHMKVEEVKIGKHITEFVHKHGRSNVPPKIEVLVAKFEEKDKKAFAMAELAGFPLEEEKPEEKKKKAAPKEEEKKEKEAEKDHSVEEEKEEKRKILEKGMEHEKLRGQSFMAKESKAEIGQIREEGVIKRTGKSDKGYSK